MPKDRLDRVEEILDRVGRRLDALAKEQKEFGRYKGILKRQPQELQGIFPNV